MKRFFIALSLIPILAHAALGDNATTTINSVTKEPNSTIVTKHDNYSIKQYVTLSGSLVKEYYANNIVFAITWSGAKKENLYNILGKYFTNYVNSQASTNNSSSYVDNDDLVVSTGGYPNKFYGKAYIKSSLPNNFNISDLDK